MCNLFFKLFIGSGPSQNRLQIVNYLSQLLLCIIPAYLLDLLTVYTTSRQLRSSVDTRTLRIPHVKTKTLMSGKSVLFSRVDRDPLCQEAVSIVSCFVFPCLQGIAMPILTENICLVFLCRQKTALSILTENPRPLFSHVDKELLRQS